jgi:hypothetical protein
MLTRSWRYSNQAMECSAQYPQPLPSTRQPKMGEFRYDGKYDSGNNASNATPNIFPPSNPGEPQHYPLVQQHHGLPVSCQPSMLLRSSTVHPQVLNTPGFHPSSGQRELFPTKMHPPVGTGRLSTYNDIRYSVPSPDVVSVTSHKIQPSDAYRNPFAGALNTYLKPDDQHPQHRIKAGSAVTHPPKIPSQNWRSGSGRNAEPPSAQIFATELAQNGVPVRSGSPARRTSVSSRRSSQADQPDRRRRPGDSSPQHGIQKKKREASLRKTAVAARAAMIQSAQKGLFSETSEGGPTTPKRSWAQVVSGQIKEEEPVDGIVTLQKVPESTLATSNRHDEPRTPSVQNKDEKVVQSKVQTWAEVASAKWIEKQSKKQQSRNRSFGKSNFKVGQYKFELKDVVNVKVKEEPKEDRYHNMTANPAKQKALPVGKGTGKTRRVCGNGGKTWMWKY